MATNKQAAAYADEIVRLREQVRRLRATIDAIGKDAQADDTVLDKSVALAKIRSRVSNVQRAALAETAQEEKK